MVFRLGGCTAYSTATQRCAVRCSIPSNSPSTDLVFRSKATLAPLYEQPARHSVLTVKAETIATFLGRKIAEPFNPPAAS